MARIDYNLRPAKHIERIMLSQALRRLGPFGAVESYRYIGFGALYYRDFRLFHRDLGITDMVSLEMDTNSQGRYEFNTPFNCVTTLFGLSIDLLPTLRWDVRTILWLDYTGKLDRDMLADVGFFAGNCVPGSVLIVTVNVQADRLSDGPLQQFTDRVAEENVPTDIHDRDLTGWGLSSTSRRVLNNKVQETLVDRNGPRSLGAKIRFGQLFNFEYADEAKMLTFGGILFEEGQKAIIASCNFDLLPFIRQEIDSYRIEVPQLTYKEIHHLQSQFPGIERPIERNGVPTEDVERFRAVYRYFPVFTPTEI
ncbi:MAG: O-methyltransferase [Candidatus Moraniibacteriota bacterium]